MARLNMAPADPPSSLSSRTSADADSAAQQLLAETRASVSSPEQQSVAIRGADLLNAARVSKAARRTSLDGMASKAGTSRLKRPSFVALPPRTKLATRGDVYDMELELSPERGIFALPETINPQPLRVVNKKTKKQPPSPIPAPIASKIEDAEQKRHISAQDIQLEHHLANKKARCTAVIYKNDNTGPHHQQCSLAGLNPTDAGPRCHIHIKKPPTVQCRAMSSYRTVSSQCRVPATTETSHGARCSFHAESELQHNSPHAPTEATTDGSDRESSDSLKAQKRKSETDSDDGRRTKVRRTAREARAQVQIPSRTRTKSAVTKAAVAVHTNDPTPPLRSKPTSKKQSRDHTKESSPADSLDGDGSVYDSIEDETHDVEDNDMDANCAEESEQPTKLSLSACIDAVLKFSDLPERLGKCKTELGTVIKRLCEKSCLKMQDADTSIVAIVAGCEDIRATLNEVETEVRSDEEYAFKADAYIHIFPRLAQYFVALYRCFDEQSDNVMESSEAMRVLLLLTHSIVTLRDTIFKWNVTLPQRYKGDQVVKEVVSGFITPLRQLERKFHVRLTSLRVEESNRRTHANLVRKREEKRHEDQRRAEPEVAKRYRWRRWQDLHIARMECEPDPRKRRNLFITKLENIDEKDANGVTFERLPVFKTRLSPPLPWRSTALEQREWTDEEETILLDGLQSYAGARVFEDIFAAYCQPGGALRGFSVTDIVTKSAWARSACLQLHQENDWKVPEWVKKVQGPIQLRHYQKDTP